MHLWWSLLVKGYGLGLVGNIVVGIVGALIAGWLLPRIGFFLASMNRPKPPIVDFRWPIIQSVGKEPPDRNRQSVGASYSYRAWRP
jgi:hypothetical protein